MRQAPVELMCGDLAHVKTLTKSSFDGQMALDASNSAYAVAALTALGLNATTDKEVLKLHIFFADCS